MSQTYKSNIRIPSDLNTYVPLCYEDKENSFYTVNNLNLPTRVPKLDISRNRSLSRQKSSISSECDSNDTSSTSGNTIQRQYQHKMAPPCPKPQKLQSQNNANVSNTHTLYKNYGLEVQRTKRSLSGYSYSAPLTEQFPITMNKISSRDNSLDYSQFSSMNYPSVLSTDYPLVPTNLAQLSQRSSEAIAPFRRRQVEIRRQLEENASFEKSVEGSLRSLHNLGIRKQEVMRDCIKDLDELYLKYKSNDSTSTSLNILGDITQTVENAIQQSKEDSQKIKADKYNFEDFQDGKSYIEENPASDFSMEQYDTPKVSQFKNL